MNDKKIPSLKWVANTISIAFILGSSGITMSYLSYAFTDLGRLPVGVVAIINFFGTVLGIVMSFTVGMVMAKKTTRHGQCRPYLFLGYTFTVVGCFIMYTAGLFDSTMTRIIIITVGFSIMMIANAVRIAAMYGIERILAGSDYDNKTLLSSRGNLGIAGGLVMEGLVILPLANIFGGGVKGFMLMEVILGVVGIIAYGYLFHVTKEYDLPDATYEDAEEAPAKISVFDMVKGLIVNRQAMCCFISDTVRLFGYFLWFSLIYYQCAYVIGDMNSMVIVLTMTNIVGVVGSYLTFYASKLVKGRRRLAVTVSILVIGSFLCVGMFGDTLWGFIIFSCIACFFCSFYDSISPMLFADAGEIWLHKTGKDTRTYITSVAGMPLNIAMALVSLGFTAVLAIINYVPDQEMTAEAAKALTWAVGIVPAICYAVPLILMGVVHGVSDADVQRYTIENEAKYGAAPLE